MPLTPTEFRLLARLAAAPGEAVRRRALVQAAWPHGAIVHDNTLDVYIARLRRKLADSAGRAAHPHRARRRLLACDEAARRGDRARGVRSAAGRRRPSVAVALALMTAGFNVLLWRSLSRDADSVVRSRAATEAASVDVVNDQRRRARGSPTAAGSRARPGCSSTAARSSGRASSAALDRAAQAPRRRPASPSTCPASRHACTRLPASDDGRTVGTVVAGVSLAPYEHTQRIALIGSLALRRRAAPASSPSWLAGCSRAALRPVARMTADAEAWSEHDPDRRFAAGEPYDELSQLAATLDGLLDRLAASLRREQRFSAELSHELRTPLAKIRAEAELALRRERQPQAYREALQAVLDGARRMSGAIDTLLLAAEHEAGLARGRSDAATVLGDVVSTCRRLAGERGVELRVDQGTDPLAIGVDADLAAHVVQPLVENACRYARSSVTLSAVRLGTEVLLTVADDGPGVSPKDVVRIFEPGVRGAADESAAPRTPGAGLGLSLARRLARAADGELELESGTAGARFVVHLPSG